MCRNRVDCAAVSNMRDKYILSLLRMDKNKLLPSIREKPENAVNPVKTHEKVCVIFSDSEILPIFALRFDWGNTGKQQLSYSN